VNPLQPKPDRQWALSWPLTVIAALLVVLLALNLALISWDAGRLRADSDRIVHANEVKVLLADLAAALRAAQGGERGFVIAGTPESREAYLAASAKVRRELGRLEHATADDSSSRALFGAVAKSVDESLRPMQRAVELRPMRRRSPRARHCRFSCSRRPASCC
jgi:CHASE3 domain sensor protein